MKYKAYIDFLTERDKVKQPYPDHDSLNMHGNPNPRCPRCHRILTNLIDLFCFTCGQRLADVKNIDSKSDEFADIRNGIKT